MAGGGQAAILKEPEFSVAISPPMKNRLTPLVIAFGLVAFSTAGCAEKAKTADSAPPPAKVVVAPVPVNATPAATPAQPAVVPVTWVDLKADTYDQRISFLAGLKSLGLQVDAQISELAAKRAAMAASNTSTKDWDFAMQEMGSARTNLKSTSEEMTRASRETWDQQKDKVGLAWVRTQDAFAKVKASTTN